MLGGVSGNASSKYNPATGEFEIRDAPAGSYTLMASDNFAPMMGANKAQIPLEISSADIESVVLTLTAGIAIRGRVRIEGSSTASETLYSQLTLLLRSRASESYLDSLISGRSPARLQSDGTFTINNVTPGDYILSVTGMEPAMYIKDARLGRLDVLQGISISDRVDGALDVTIGSGAGELSGTVVDKSGRVAAGNQTVVLIPDSLRNRIDLYKTADTTADGRFTIRGITPGNYKVFAWEDIEPFSYFDAEVLKAYDTQGKPVRIQENSRDSIEVTVIPAG
jgi:hypothetical protein